MTNTRSLTHVPLLVCLATAQAAAQSGAALERGFTQPPPETRPGIYWYWMSDNISRQGITRDLEAMARAGIGEAFIGNVDQLRESPGKVKVLTEEWWSLVEHAVREGGRVGVRISLFNSPGWSQSGGPWVKPEQSMRYVTMSETRASGPSRFTGTLPAPKSHFQDIAVLAFPVPQGEGTRALQPDAAAVSVLPASAATAPYAVDMAAADSFTARSLVLHPAERPFAVQVELQADDGAGAFQTVRRFTCDRSNASTQVGPMAYGPVAVAFAPVTARRFRLVFSGMKGSGGFARIELSGAAKLERFVEKQLGKMWQTPSPLWDAYLWPAQPELDTAGLAVPPERTVNLTPRLAPGGKLEWDVPPGEWIILRAGMTSTGVTNSPASPEGTGLEIDKMNRALVQGHFDAFTGTLLKRMPAADRASLLHVIADSYETGSQNWTDGFAADFERRYGYDPLPWLATLSGRIVRNADASDRFLWDLRRLVADRVASDYVGGLRDAAARQGLKIWLENYGHWGFPGEFLQYGGQSPEIGGEFWAGGGLGAIELRAAASAAHIYGKPVVSAEAFTGGPLWQSTPWSLKARGDWATAQGVNHFILHVYIHQPYEERVPGISAWFGTEFNRFNTWFAQAREWIDSLRRAHFLLRQGRQVADVAVFIGEDAPKMTGPAEPRLAEGFAFDYINAEVMEQRLAVRDGKFVLPGGASYRLLVLPELATMRPALLRKIRDLVRAGGVILGAPPERSPSLEGYPACDREVREMARELWQSCDGKAATSAVFGKGKVFRGVSPESVLAQLGVGPDVSGTPAGVPWTHRAGPEGDIYFLSHQGDAPAAYSASFRVAGRQPELWDAVTGERRELPRFTQQKGRTVVPLEFAPRQSLFVVFRKPAQPRPAAGGNFPAPRVLGELSGAWTVAFEEKWGGPARIEFDSLADWTTRPEEGIRHYSGTAVYRKRFDMPGTSRGRVYIDLGTVGDMARVRLNGKDLGLVWCAPWRAAVSSALREKDNELEIEVVNTWNNRLVGDAGLAPAERRTWVGLSRLTPKSPLLPAGLLGPVRLVEEE